jgi:acyl carrier protein
MREQALKLIYQSVKTLNETLEHPVNCDAGEDTLLFGGDGVLDSMALVSLIVLLEEQIELTLGRNLILASEKAMSQKRSPFASIGALASYLESSLADEVNHVSA